MMLPTLLIGPWVLRRMAAVPPSQVYRVILDAVAEAVDDANRVRIAASNSESANLSVGGDEPEAGGRDVGASDAERRER